MIVPIWMMAVYCIHCILTTVSQHSLREAISSGRETYHGFALSRVEGRPWEVLSSFWSILGLVWMSQQRHFFTYFHCQIHRCCWGVCFSSSSSVSRAPAFGFFTNRTNIQVTEHMASHMELQYIRMLLEIKDVVHIKLSFENKNKSLSN